MRKAKKLRVLFLCTGNSCRSQMAEAWARHLRPDLIDAYSAGLEPKGLDPMAVKVMAEVGVDMSGQISKHLDQFKGQTFDYVIAVCDHAKEVCPVFAGARRLIHVGFEDPPTLAKDAHSEQEALGHYRRVRDQIRQFVEGMPDSLEKIDG
ncbi:MAG: arsenate reductase ArsC [Sedimentisphaerales bacterium]|nr:arsenate reductase ArsC [Sedimentisphaerales bacterium]